MNDTTTQTATPQTEKVKVKRVLRPSTTAKPVTAPKGKAKTPPKAEAPKAKATAPRAEKPTTPKYTFDSGYTQQSDVTNSKASRTPIDLSRFGQFNDAPMSERDECAVRALRKQFGEKPFQRLNLDAGIIRRLGERGCIVHVSGSNVAADTTFRLTNKGLGKPEAPRARKAKAA